MTEGLVYYDLRRRELRAVADAFARRGPIESLRWRSWVVAGAHVRGGMEIADLYQSASAPPEVLLAPPGCEGRIIQVVTEIAYEALDAPPAQLLLELVPDGTPEQELTDAKTAPIGHSSRSAAAPAAPSPLLPDGEDSYLRLHNRIDLAQSTRSALPESALICSGQFMYFDPTDRARRLAPDLLVRLDAGLSSPNAWLVWEHRTPHLAVEIAGRALDPEAWREHLACYRNLVQGQLVLFNQWDTQRPLRIWDVKQGDLQERDLGHGHSTYCEVVGAYWVIHREPTLGPMLRLANDAAGRELLQTPGEALRYAVQAREEAVQAREALEEALAQARAETAQIRRRTLAQVSQLAREHSAADLAAHLARLCGETEPPPPGPGRGSLECRREPCSGGEQEKPRTE